MSLLPIQRCITYHHTESMQPLRQTHLGSKATKLLAIVDLHGPPPWPSTIIQSEKAYILHRLPDELLLLIVKFSLYTNGRTTREATRGTWALFEDVRAYDNSCIMALSMVCHRLKGIAQPLLFSNIGFMYPDKVLPPSIRVLRLHRTLIDRVDLRQHCRWVFHPPSLILRIPVVLRISVHTAYNMHIKRIFHCP